MSIESFVKRLVNKDTAVYWGPETSLGADGEPAFGEPEQIKCFWDDVTETVMGDNGQEFVSRATVIVSQDLVQEGILFHGKLIDLTTAQRADHRKVHMAYEIKVFKKAPSLNYGHVRQAII